MKCVIQRVSGASVSIDGEITGKIEQGLLLLLGVVPRDDEQAAQQLARKAVNMRIFSDDAGRMNLSLSDIGGSMLIVSQFTLCADCRHGNRPSFTGACEPKRAQQLYEYFCGLVEQEGIAVQTGRFGEDMQVSLINDGPVTILLDTEQLAGNKNAN